MPVSLSLRPFRLSWRVLSVALLPVLPLAGQTVHNIWDPPLKQGIAARAEDRIITFQELRREIAPLIEGVRRESRSPVEFEQRMSELYLEVLQTLIDRILIVKEFERKEYKLPPSYVETEINRRLIEDFNNDRSRFLEYLRSQGMTMRDYRRDLGEQIIVSVMRGQQRRSASEISPERIESFYNDNKIYFYQEESVHLRLIMLKPITDESPDLLRQTANRVLAELREGALFADVAAKYSQDSRRNRGGDWGWINRADLRPELSDVAFSLQPGQFSEPVALADQLFILYVEARRPEGIQPIEEVRERIEQILASQLARQAVGRWLERLRRDAFVIYY